MDDLISRSAVLKRLETLRRNYTLKAGYREAMTDAIGELRSTPALDVAPVVHARWRYKVAYAVNARVTNIIYCTACGKGFHRVEGVNFNFCPNCGARMDGEAYV